MRDEASRGCCATSAANATARATQVPAGTTSSAKPAASASSTGTARPARSQRTAVPRATRSTRFDAPPQPVVTAKRACTQWKRTPASHTR